MNSHAGIEGLLRQGLNGLQLSLSEDSVAGLVQYCSLLVKWNKTYNLTAIIEESQMVTHHLLDSLAVLPHLPGGRVIDVGTGAGLPGIPLALARPDQQFTLLDGNGKKTRFLVQVVGELSLQNVEVINRRVEDYQPTLLFDVVISRAFASLTDMIGTCAHLLSAGGVFVAMKGKFPEDEISEISPPFQLLSSIALEIPGLGAERHLLMLGRR